jgi:hypothetical protein
MKVWIDEISDFMAAQEQASPLATMISAVAEGKPLTAHDRARMRLLMVDRAQERGLSWAAIATAFGYPSGKQAKKMIHGLRVRVKREQALGGLGSRP